jgi:hypothetical protein
MRSGCRRIVPDLAYLQEILDTYCHWPGCSARKRAGLQAAQETGANPAGLTEAHIGFGSDRA